MSPSALNPAFTANKVICRDNEDFFIVKSYLSTSNTLQQIQIPESCPVDQFLARGKHGEVYTLRDQNNIFKIGVREESYVKEVVARLKRIQSLNLPCISNIIETDFVRYVAEPFDKDCFYYVSPKYLPVPKDEYRYIVQRWWRLFDGDFYAWSDLTTSPMKAIKSERVKSDISWRTQARTFVDSVIANKVFHLDFHNGNIMKDVRGNYKFIDLEAIRFDTEEDD